MCKYNRGSSGVLLNPKKKSRVGILGAQLFSGCEWSWFGSVLQLITNKNLENAGIGKREPCADLEGICGQQ